MYGGYTIIVLVLQVSQMEFGLALIVQVTDSHCMYYVVFFCFHVTLTFCCAVSGKVSAFESLFLLETLVSSEETLAWAGIVK